MGKQNVGNLVKEVERLSLITINNHIIIMIIIIRFMHVISIISMNNIIIPTYDDNVCSELLLSREQSNFRSCCL